MCREPHRCPRRGGGRIGAAGHGRLRTGTGVAAAAQVGAVVVAHIIQRHLIHRDAFERHEMKFKLDLNSNEFHFSDALCPDLYTGSQPARSSAKGKSCAGCGAVV